MKSIHHLLIALVCYLIIIFHYTYSFEIITHPYMWFLMTGLFCVGGWNFGVGVGKVREELKTDKK